MSGAIHYPSADLSQWAQDEYPGSAMEPNCVVLHTTETRGWPSYSTGYWPTLTYWHGHGWRQHLDLTRSARALENASGGVETNTLNCVQIELVGTCDPAYLRRYGGFFWPDNQPDAMRAVADFLGWLHGQWPRFRLYPATPWLAYPQSYGLNNGSRMSYAAWRNFYGVCGHQHVPENHHGDPGDIDAYQLMAYAKDETEDDDVAAKDVWDYKIKNVNQKGEYQNDLPASWFLTNVERTQDMIQQRQLAAEKRDVALAKAVQAVADGLGDTVATAVREALADATVDVDVTVHGDQAETS